MIPTPTIEERMAYTLCRRGLGPYLYAMCEDDRGAKNQRAVVVGPWRRTKGGAWEAGILAVRK